MQSPAVTFLVPCYRLANLLPECIQSILSQSYGDFEILIMDNSSPDNTPEVARSFLDHRVVHVRNEQNLGHLQNYNKGISMSRGDYIWLISADDRLRRPYLLAQYMEAMQKNPGVGYACCPGVALQNGVESRVEGSLGPKNCIYDGKHFLKMLLKGNFITAASGLVRRTCYETCGNFPPDLPFAGDWFLWCLFALRYQVAYFAEPMVNYRAHELSMTNYLMSHKSVPALREGFLVLWRIRKHALETGAVGIARECERRLARMYGAHIAGVPYAGRTYCMTEKEFEASLVQHDLTRAEQRQLQARTWETVGDTSFRQKDYPAARAYYTRALERKKLMPKAWGKPLLLGTGGFGLAVAGIFFG